MGNVKEIVKPAIILFIICLIATALLALTNSVTAQPIADQAVKAENDARSAVIPAEKFSESKTVSYKGEDFIEGDYTYNEAYDKDGKLVGYTVTTVSKGYGGDIKVMTGVDLDGKVTGVEILEINETAGLGMKAKNDDFKAEYKGKTAGIEVKTNSVTPSSDNYIDALTGATITSKAVTNAVNLALTLIEQTGGSTIG